MSQGKPLDSPIINYIETRPPAHSIMYLVDPSGTVTATQQYKIRWGDMEGYFSGTAGGGQLGGLSPTSDEFIYTAGGSYVLGTFSPFARTLVDDTTAADMRTTLGAQVTGSAGGGSGDVTGPASATDDAIVRFDGTTGKIIQGYTSNAPTISDSGAAIFRNTFSQQVSNSATNSISDLGTIAHNSTNLSNIGFGSAVLFKLESRFVDDREAGRIAFYWGDSATDASRAAAGKLSAYYTTNERNVVVWKATSVWGEVDLNGSTDIEWKGTNTTELKDVLTIKNNLSSGTVGNGFGSRILFALESAVGVENRNAGSIYVKYADAVSGLTAGGITGYAGGSTELDVITWELTGTLPQQTKMGFFGASPVFSSNGWTTFTNLSTDKTCNADSTTVGELADILGTLIEYLKDIGLLRA